MSWSTSSPTARCWPGSWNCGPSTKTCSWWWSGWWARPLRGSETTSTPVRRISTTGGQSQSLSLSLRPDLGSVQVSLPLWVCGPDWVGDQGLPVCGVGKLWLHLWLPVWNLLSWSDLHLQLLTLNQSASILSITRTRHSNEKKINLFLMSINVLIFWSDLVVKCHVKLEFLIENIHPSIFLW